MFSVPLSGFDRKEMNKNQTTNPLSADISAGGSEAKDQHSSVFYVDHTDEIEFPTRRPKKLKSAGVSEKTGEQSSVSNKKPNPYFRRFFLANLANSQLS